MICAQYKYIKYKLGCFNIFYLYHFGYFSLSQYYASVLTLCDAYGIKLAMGVILLWYIAFVICYMHANLYTTYLHRQVCICTCMYSYVGMYINTYMHTFMNTYIHALMCVYLYT